MNLYIFIVADGYCEPNIDAILKELHYKSIRKDLKKGNFLFSSHWTEAHFWLVLSKKSKNNPVVIDYEKRYWAGSFEKYLFQKAFELYEDTFVHTFSFGLSRYECNEKKVLEESCKTCPIYGRTTKERMDFVRQLVAGYDIQKAWFSDQVHFFVVNEKYTLAIIIDEGFVLRFSCNDIELKEKAKYELYDKYMNRKLI